MADKDAFGRNLGYLDRFLDELETHASTLPRETGDRLRALLAEERGRWAEIRSLIGAAGPSAPAPAAQQEAAPVAEPVRPYTRAFRIGTAQLQNLPPLPAQPPAAPREPEVRTPTGNARTAFTVGSLKPRR